MPSSGASRRAALAGFAALALGLFSRCGGETFDLLPAHADAGASAAGAGGAGGSDGLPPPCGFTPCPDASFECPPSNQFCTPCFDGRDCNDPDHPFCHPKSHICVQCVDDSPCGFGDHCNALTGHCDHACIYSTDCNPMQNPICDTGLSVCVDCISDSHCRGQSTKPYCYLGECVECYQGVGCGQGAVCVDFHCQHH